MALWNPLACLCSTAVHSCLGISSVYERAVLDLAFGHCRRKAKQNPTVFSCLCNHLHEGSFLFIDMCELSHKQLENNANYCYCSVYELGFSPLVENWGCKMSPISQTYLFSLPKSHFKPWFFSLYQLRSHSTNQAKVPSFNLWCLWETHSPTDPLNNTTVPDISSQKVLR